MRTSVCRVSAAADPASRSVARRLASYCVEYFAEPYAQQLVAGRGDRTFWFYDSFQGLPKPHEKDVLIHDIFNKGTVTAYEGEICMPERYVREKLESV
ncbi:MAG: hypothetical protein WCQ91_07610 [Planctomycetota bacterium]